MMARLAAVLLLAAFVAPNASAQFIYVANAGEDTVSKIDINPPYNEVARYATWFTPGSPNNVPYHDAWTGPAPSRIARDAAGNVYVLDRFFPEHSSGGGPPPVPPMHLPVLLKIAPTGGTTTSSGPAVLSMTDTNNDNHIDLPNEATDQRIKWATEIGIAGKDEGALGRSLCMDPSGFLWVGMFHTQRYYKVDPANGQVLGPPVELGPPAFNPGHRPYGCQVDAKGKLWSVDIEHTLAEIDTTTNKVVKIHDHGTPKDYGRNYSISLFNGCGSAPSKVYLSEWKDWRSPTGAVLPAKTYIAYDPQTSTFSNSPPTIPQFASHAIAVDRNGDIVSGEWSGTGRVIKTTPGGIVLWDTDTLPAGPAVKTAQLRGIIIDEHNDVWAVHLMDDRVVKYSGGDGHVITTVKVGKSPYTYGNPPPPTCPCAQIGEQKITCEKQKDGKATYSWSFTFTNHSPFSMPATGIDISSTQVTNLLPTQFAFTPAVPPNGQATVSGTFEVDKPVPGSMVCLDIRLNFGEVGWCCPTERVCFVLPECPTCAKLEGVFKCSHGRRYLELSVTNLGPTAAQGAQIFSNTPGVTVTPQTTTQTFPQNTPVIVPLSVTGATPGQVISLSVMLHGPIDPKTGVYSWCCTAIVKVTYPIWPCWWWPDGDLFDDVNLNGRRDSGEGGLAEWTVTLIDAKGTTHTTKSDASGKYQFEEIEPGKSRLSVQPPRGWRATTPKGGVNSLSVEAPPKGKLDFGFTKAR